MDFILFSCIGKKTGNVYRRLIRAVDVKGVAEDPNDKQVLLILSGTERKFFKSKPNYVPVTETFEEVQEKLKRKSLAR